MLAADSPWCAECAKKNKKGVMIKQEVSRLHEGLGIEKFKCDRCGAMYAVRPGQTRPFVCNRLR